MKKNLVNILLLLICALAYVAQYVKWEVFASHNTLMEFDYEGFWMILGFSAIAISLSYSKYSPKIYTKLGLFLFSAIIIAHLLIKAGRLTGTLSDGTTVTAQKLWGFYLIIALLTAYAVIALLDVLKQAGQRD